MKDSKQKSDGRRAKKLARRFPKRLSLKKILRSRKQPTISDLRNIGGDIYPLPTQRFRWLPGLLSRHNHFRSLMTGAVEKLHWTN